MGEDVVFSDDGSYWCCSCMRTQAMIVGDAKTTMPAQAVRCSTLTSGIAIHNGIDASCDPAQSALQTGRGGEVTRGGGKHGKVLGTSSLEKPRRRGSAGEIVVPGPIRGRLVTKVADAWTAPGTPRSGIRARKAMISPRRPGVR